MSRIYVRGVSREASDHGLERAIKRILIESTDDLAWLSPGQTVLLKPAVNSPYPYPSTTHPLAIKAVADELLSRGAKVIVGDQGGIGHVMHTPKGIEKGSTRQMFQETGIAKVLDPSVTQVAFEEEDWEKDFFLFKSEKAASWPNGFYMTRWIEKADHIINLPRLSTHSMAGVTLGFKNLVGFMREDSRIEFHAQGPFFDVMKLWAKGAGFKTDFSHRGDFWEKIVEIYLSMQDKMRLTLFVGTKAQTTFGPDKYTYRLFGGRLASQVAEPDMGVVFASQDPVAAEAYAIAYLTLLYRDAPMHKKIMQKTLLRLNGKVKELGTYNPWDNPFVAHALALGLGDRDFDLITDGVDKTVLDELDKSLK